MKFRMAAYQRIYFEKMTRHKRAGKDGKIIQCPKCQNGTRVYHLSWVALKCSNCKEMIGKYKWKIEISKNKK